MNGMIIAGFDLETTGLLSPDHRIVEIYLDLWRDGKRIWKFEQRINPQRAIAADAQRVHGITNADLIGKPTFEQVAPVISKALRKAHVVVAHNGEEFDWPFLEQEMKRAAIALPRVPLFDTMKRGIWATPHGKNPSLMELCFACGVEYDPAKAHAASYDVEVMIECLRKGIEWNFFDLTDCTEGNNVAA
jgi:DNA polymerase-3 subunit epsilon